MTIHQDFFGDHVAGDVERVVGVAKTGLQLADLVRGLRLQVRQSEAEVGADVGREARKPARTAGDGDAAAGRRLGTGQQVWCQEQVIERVHAGDAELLEQRIIGAVVAGECGGVRHRRLAAAFRPADLQRDDRLVGIRRQFTGGTEAINAADRLDEQRDGARLLILDQELDAVAEIDVGLIPGRERVAQADALQTKRGR